MKGERGLLNHAEIAPEAAISLNFVRFGTL